MSARLMMLAALLTGCGHSTADSLVIVHVTGTLTGLRQLRVTATLEGAGTMAGPLLFPHTAPTADLVLPTSLALRTPAGQSGRLVIGLEGLDAAGQPVVTAPSATLAFAAGDREDVTVCLTPCGDADAGTSDGAADDGAPADAARDAGPEVDAAPPTDGGLPVDAARLVDAAPPGDAAPRPPVVNGQAADLVLGQTNFVLSAANSGGQSAGSLSHANGAVSVGNHLWVVDRSNRRVLQWNSLPSSNKAPADLVVGQSSFTTSIVGVTQAILGDPISVFSDGRRLLVSDMGGSRVVIWNSLPTVSGQPADLVLGHADFTTSFPATGAGGFDIPEGIWADDSHVIVVDNWYERVLIWNHFPTANGEPADVVLGRADFAVGTDQPTPPTAASLRRPAGVWFDGSHLFVADQFNNRVMVWNGIPTVSGTPADFVIGQPDTSSGLANAGQAGVNAGGFDEPAGLTVAGGSLFVSDLGNRRILVYTPVPTGSGQVGRAVLGQSDFTTGSAPTTVSADRFAGSESVSGTGNQLFLDDGARNRVLRFTLRP